MPKEHVTDLLTTIETLAGYACEDSHTWKKEDDDNFAADSFFFAIELMAREAKGWMKHIHTTDK